MPSSNVSYLFLRLCLSSEASSIMPARMSVVEHAIDDAPSIHGCGDVLHRSRNGNCRFRAPLTMPAGHEEHEYCTAVETRLPFMCVCNRQLTAAYMNRIS